MRLKVVRLYRKLNIMYSGAYLKVGEKGMRFKSAAAPATVIEDKPLNATL